MAKKTTSTTSITSNEKEKTMKTTSTTSTYDWRLDAELQAFEAAAAAVASTTPAKASKPAKAREAKRIVAPIWGNSFNDCAMQLLTALNAYGQTTLYRLAYLYITLKLSDYESALREYESFDALAYVMDGIVSKGGDVEKAAAMRKQGVTLCEIAEKFGIEMNAPQNPGSEEAYTRAIFFEAATVALAIGRESRDDATKRRNFQRVFNEFANSEKGRAIGAVNSATACKGVAKLLEQTILILTVQFNDEMCDLHLPDCMKDLIPTQKVIKVETSKPVLPAGLSRK